MGVLRQFCPLCLPPQSFFFAPLKFTPDLLKRFLCFAITGSVDRKLGGNPLTLMYDFSYPLGNAVKSTRYQRGLTQLQVADMADIDVRTVMNIENYKANPKMEVLYPLVRALRIDARTIFTPELQRESPALQQLRLMVEECSEQEAEALIPVMESVLSALRAKDTIEIR